MSQLNHPNHAEHHSAHYTRKARRRPWKRWQRARRWVIVVGYTIVGVAWWMRPAPKSAGAAPIGNPMPMVAATTEGKKIVIIRPGPVVGGPGVVKLGKTVGDKGNGYSVRMPIGYAAGKTADRPFSMDATDGVRHVEVGTSQWKLTTDLEGMARQVVQRFGGEAQGSGHVQVGGRDAICVRYSGVAKTTAGTGQVDVVHYVVPLESGRALEVRFVAPAGGVEKMEETIRSVMGSVKLRTAAQRKATADD